MTEEIQEGRKIFQAAGSYADPMPGMSLWGSDGIGKDVLNKFNFPKDYFKVVELCYHYFRTDPIISNTVSKILDIGFRDFYVQRGECSDEEYSVYSSVGTDMLWHLRELGQEYLLSGLVIPEVTWKTVPGSELSPDLGDKLYEVPDVLWKRDPFTIKLRKTPIPKRVSVSVIPSEDDVAFILNNGVYGDGTKDTETWNLLWKNYRSFCLQVKAGKREFPLEDPFLIRRNPLPDHPYPLPYLVPVLEALEHKRNLRKMDYSIAARVITAIMQISIGSDEFPLVEEEDDVVTELMKQFRWRYRQNNIDRVFQLFTNHTVAINWIMPDVAALLDESKYEAVNLDILFGLGFPRIMLTGETARSGTSQAEFALLSPAETIKSIREMMLPWADKIYREMMVRNNFSNLPSPKFGEIRLFDLAKILEVADIIYERGALSKTTLARLGGFDFESEELPLRVKEGELFKSLDIDEYPAMPFDKPEGADTDNGSDTTKSE